MFGYDSLLNAVSKSCLAVPWGEREKKFSNINDEKIE